MSVPGKYRRSEYSELLWGDDKINGIVDNLKSMGLTEYESKALCALFLKKEATAPEISDFARIPNTKLYYVLEGLEKHGLIKSKDGRPKKFYVTDPEEVLDRIEERYLEKMKTFEEIKKSTLEIVRDVYEYAKYYQEVRHSRVMINLVDMVHSLIYLKKNTNSWLAVAQSNVWRLVVNNPKNRKVILEELPKGKEYKEIIDSNILRETVEFKKAEETWRWMVSLPNVEVRILPPQQVKHNVMICDGILTAIVFDIQEVSGSVLGVMIRDKHFAESATEYFYKMWDRAMTLEEYLEKFAENTRNQVEKQ